MSSVHPRSGYPKLATTLRILALVWFSLVTLFYALAFIISFAGADDVAAWAKAIYNAYKPFRFPWLVGAALMIPTWAGTWIAMAIEPTDERERPLRESDLATPLLFMCAFPVALWFISFGVSYVVTYWMDYALGISFMLLIGLCMLASGAVSWIRKKLRAQATDDASLPDPAVAAPSPTADDVEGRGPVAANLNDESLDEDMDDFDELDDLDDVTDVEDDDDEDDLDDVDGGDGPTHAKPS